MKEASYLRLDSTKSMDRLGWHPRWNLEQGVVQTVEWHKAFLNSEDMQKVSMKQISEYMQS
ncbi:MAG: hypothetical protein HKN08_01295 [Gammaproteobacteria bacterium]|nr:hypothetical protein [Gammaproteobacteria bacterium]